MRTFRIQGSTVKGRSYEKNGSYGKEFIKYPTGTICMQIPMVLPPNPQFPRIHSWKSKESPYAAVFPHRLAGRIQLP